MLTAEQILKKLKDYIKHQKINDSQLETLILSAKPNDKQKTKNQKGKTEFPDFLSSNGFIEHFNITSGISNRNGYVITRQNIINNKQHEQYYQNPNVKKLETTLDRSKNNNSIDNLHKSMKEHLLDHLDSYDKYNNGKVHLSCFLLSSDDLLKTRLYSAENCSEDKFIKIENELAKTNKYYNMRFDKWLLEFVYSYKDKIDYIIYFNQNRNYFDILAIKNIPTIIMDLHNDVFIYSYENQPIQSISNVSGLSSF